MVRPRLRLLPILIVERLLTAARCSGPVGRAKWSQIGRCQTSTSLPAPRSRAASRTSAPAAGVLHATPTDLQMVICSEEVGPLAGPGDQLADLGADGVGSCEPVTDRPKKVVEPRRRGGDKDGGAGCDHHQRIHGGCGVGASPRLAQMSVTGAPSCASTPQGTCWKGWLGGRLSPLLTPGPRTRPAGARICARQPLVGEALRI